MELLLTAISLLLVLPSSRSTFVYPDEVGEFRVPGVRTMPARRDPDGAAIHFPDVFVRPSTRRPTGPRKPPTSPKPDTLEMPDDLHTLDLGTLNLLNRVANISDFAELFGLDLPEEDSLNFTVASRFGSDEPVELASMANCKPELRTVELDLPQDPHTAYFPTCIRLEQCGGCCFGPLLTCRPTVTKAVKVKVLKTSTSSSGGSSRRRGGRRRRRENTASFHTVSVVKHTACECGCKVQSTDCNSTIHTYYEGECACVCKDRDEKAKCEEQNGTKYWSDETCSCYCRNPQACGSGEYFSQATCTCEHLSGRSGIVFGEGSTA